MYSDDTTRRFWAKVQKTEGCWLWVGTKGKDGYGRVVIQGRRRGANRVAYELANGPLAPGMWALHTCDNPACVRPDHLYEGTHQDNIRDRHDRGRTAAGERSPASLHPELYRGERNGNAKVNWTIVRQMRQEYAAGGISATQLARKYGIGRSQAHNIVANKNWRHTANALTEDWQESGPEPQGEIGL